MSGPTKAMLSAIRRVGARALSLPGTPFARIECSEDSVTIVSERLYTVVGGDGQMPRILTLRVKSPRTMDARAAFEGSGCLVSFYNLTALAEGRAEWCGALHSEKDPEAAMRFCFWKIDEMTRG